MNRRSFLSKLAGGAVVVAVPVVAAPTYRVGMQDVWTKADRARLLAYFAKKRREELLARKAAGDPEWNVIRYNFPHQFNGGEG